MGTPHASSPHALPLHRWLLGVVTEGEREGTYMIEDLNASVPLDLSSAVIPTPQCIHTPPPPTHRSAQRMPSTSPRFITESSIILAEGRMIDGSFVVKVHRRGSVVWGRGEGLQIEASQCGLRDHSSCVSATRLSAS